MAQNEIKSDNVYGRKFDHITEFYDYLSNGERQWPWRDHYTESSKDGSYSWTGTRSYEEASDLLLHGDPDAKRRIDNKGVANMMNKVNHMEKQRNTYLSPCGFLPHVPNFLAGRPNSMIAERMELKRKRVLTVCYNVAALGGEDANEMQQVASDVLSAILKIESGGVRVNLWAVAISSSLNAIREKDYVCTAVKIKDSNQHIDLLKMAYPLTHPSMFRRHVFKFREVLPGLPSHFAPGYGCTEQDGDRMAQCVKHLGIQADAVLGFYMCRGWSYEQIIEKITGSNK